MQFQINFQVQISEKKSFFYIYDNTETFVYCNTILVSYISFKSCLHDNVTSSRIPFTLMKSSYLLSSITDILNNNQLVKASVKLVNMLMRNFVTLQQLNERVKSSTSDSVKDYISLQHN